MPLNHLLEGPIVLIVRGKAITESKGARWISPTISTMGIFLYKQEMTLLAIEEDSVRAIFARTVDLTQS